MIIAIEVNSTKPFLSLSLPEKRDVVENIFNIKVFGEMLKLLKKKVSALKVDKAIHEASIKRLESSISFLKSQIKEIENSIKNFDSDKQRDLLENLALIEKEKSNLQSIKDKLNEINDKILELNPSTEDFQSQLSVLVGQKMTEENNVKTQTKQITFINKHTDCPLCGSVMTDEHKQKELEKIEKSIAKSNKLIEKNTKLIDKLNINIRNNNEVISNKNKLIESSNRLKDNIKNSESIITRLLSDSSKIKAREFSLDVTSFKEQYNNQIEEYKSTIKLNDSIDHKLKIFELGAKTLAEDGIKSYFYKSLI